MIVRPTLPHFCVRSSSLADICSALVDVRFVPIADISEMN